MMRRFLTQVLQSAAVVAAMAAFSFSQETPGEGATFPAVAELHERLETMKANLTRVEAENQQLGAELKRALAEQQSDAEPLKDAQVQVFTLRHAEAPSAAEYIEVLLGTKGLRLAVDVEHNLLLAAGTQPQMDSLRGLVELIDQRSQETEQRQQAEAAGPSNSETRQLSVRLFWLADGLQATSETDPERFLPAIVIDGAAKLGLENPQLVAQTITSLAVGSEDSTPFQVESPAILFGQPISFSASGKLRREEDGYVLLTTQIKVDVPSGQSSVVSGSLRMELGHFMVLGTGTSVFVTGNPGGYAGRGGYGGGYGRGGYGGGYGAPRHVVGENSGESEAQKKAADEFAHAVATPKVESSRFAFVVQVVRGESYEADEAAAK